MPRLSAYIAALLAGVFAALAIAACGGGGAELLPGKTADEIKENLNKVEERANAGDCGGAEEATAEIYVQVEDEDLQVDSRLRRALIEGVDRLSAIVAECEEDEAEPADTVDTEAEEEPEEEEEQTKPGKDKKEEPEAEEREEEPETGEGEETTEQAPSEPEEAPSGGVGPAAPAEGE